MNQQQAELVRLAVAAPAHLDALWTLIDWSGDVAVDEPETIADVADPYFIGWLHAEAGKPCNAYEHYIRLGDIAQYELGWQDATIAIAEAVDYEEDMLDREYHARGSW